MSTLTVTELKAALTNAVQLPIGATKATLVELYDNTFPTVERAGKIAREWDGAMRQNKAKRVMLIDAIAYTFTHKSEDEGVALATAILSNLGNENGRILKKELSAKGKKFQSEHGLVFAVALENQPKTDPDKDKPWAQCHPAGTSIWNDKRLVIKTAVTIKKVEKPAGSGETEAAKKEREAAAAAAAVKLETELAAAQAAQAAAEAAHTAAIAEGKTAAEAAAAAAAAQDTLEAEQAAAAAAAAAATPDASPKGQQESDEVIELRKKADAMTAINEALDTLAGDWRSLMLVYNNVADAISRLSEADRKLMEQASS